MPDAGASTHYNYPLLELVHSKSGVASGVDNAVGNTDFARIALQMVSGSRAFRNYNALINVPGTNVAGNFRGMVVSAKWRTVFQFSSKTENILGNLGYLASIAANIAESAPQIDAILGSPDPAYMKGLRITTVAGTIAERTLIGVVPAGVHLIYQSLEGWAMLAGLLGGPVKPAADGAITVLQNADNLVQTTFQTITNTETQGKAIWWVINLAAAPRGR